MDLSGDTYIIGSPFDNDMGIYNWYVYVFFRWYNGTWEEAQKLAPIYAEAGYWFGVSVAISGDTAVIGFQYDNEMVNDSGYGYLYTEIGRKWNKSGKIVPEDGASCDKFVYSVALFGESLYLWCPLCRRIKWWICIHR